MANKKRGKPKHLGRGLASLLGPTTSGGAEAVLKSGLGTPSAKTKLQMLKTKSGLGMLSAKTVLQMLKTKSRLGMLKTRSALGMLKTCSALGILSTKTALGIDISEGPPVLSCESKNGGTQTLINLALLRRDKNGIELLKTASGPVPDGAIRDGNIEEPVALAKAIKELQTRNKMHANHAAMSLVAEPVLIQILDLPKDVPGNIRQFVQDEVKHYAKLPIKKVVTDFCGIKRTARSGYARALVVATDSQKITEAAKALNSEGLNIDAIEPASVAYIRACYAKKIAERFDRNLLFAIVHRNILTLCVFRN